MHQMKQNLVPYRSLKQVAYDNNFMSLIAAAGMIAVKFGTDSTETAVLAMVPVLLSAAYLSEWLAMRRARSRGAELITVQEWYRRTFIERSEWSLVENIAQVMLPLSLLATVFALGVLPFQLWPWAFVGTLAGAVTGIVGGVYGWVYARAAVGATEDSTAPSASPFVQVAMRHYAGYVVGLAAQLTTAINVPHEIWAGPLQIAVFLISKIACDFLLPPVRYGVSEMPSLSMLALFQSCLFAVVWWGVPLGLAVTILHHSTSPEVRLADYVVIALSSAGGAVVFALFLSVLSRVRGSGAANRT
jgi:hypothetical protein